MDTSTHTPLWAMSRKWLEFIAEDENQPFERRKLAAEELQDRGIELGAEASDLVERISAYSAS